MGMNRTAQDLAHGVDVRMLREPMHENHLEWCPEYTEGSMPLAIIVKGKGPTNPIWGIEVTFE